MFKSVPIFAFLFSITGALELGDRCVKNPDQCDTLKHLVCTEFGPGNLLCQCNTDISFQHPEFPVCLKYVEELYQPCEINTEQCVKIEGAICSPFNSTCSCDPVHIQHPNDLQCLPIRDQLHAPCLPEASQCLLQGSYCSPTSQVCECDPWHYFEQDFVCLPLEPVPDRPCQDINDCLNIPGTVCQDFTCTCEYPWFESPDGLKCLRLAEFVNEGCQTSEQCRLLPRTDCKSSTCQCLEEHVQCENRQCCLPWSTGVGGECQEQDQCKMGIGNEANCESRICVCSAGFVGSDNLSECLQARNYGESCQSNSQCQSLGSEGLCGNGVCDCNSNSGYLNMKCYLHKRLHERCSYLEECILGINEFASCDPTLSSCICQTGTVELNRSCVQKLVIGDPCLDDESCQNSIPGPVECDLESGNCTCIFKESVFAGGCSHASSYLKPLSVLLVLSFICSLIIL